MAAGEFTASALLELRLKAEQRWKDSANQTQFTPNAEAARAVLANQTATFTELNDRDKDNKIRVTWLSSCGAEVEDCETNCDLDEPELESASKLYEPNICKKIGFAIDAEKMRTNDYDVSDQVTLGMATRIKALDEYWATRILAELKVFAGPNVAPAPFTYDNTNKTTNVPTADYNVKIIANFLQQAMLNNMGNPYFIDNGSFYLDWINAQLDSGNLDGKGDAARIQQLKMYFDQFNFAKAGLTEDTFMISPGAVALKTVNRNPDTPTLIGGQIQQTVYTVPSIALPGVRYDVYYGLTCKTVSNKSHYMHTWRLETNGLIALNPEACPVTIDVGGTPTVVTPTGVLSYTKV